MSFSIFTIQNLEDLRKVIKSSIKDTNNSPNKAVQNSVSNFLEQTGLIDEAVELLKYELQCAICQGLPLDACLTDCRHIFCETCLDRCQTVDKWRCPMCRTELSESQFYPTRLHQSDKIIDVVMSKLDSQYILWKKQELFERSWHILIGYLRMVHDKIYAFLEGLETEKGIEKYRQKLENLAGELLLLTELPCSKTNKKYIRIREQEICKAARHTIRKILQFSEFSVDLTESYSVLKYLSITSE